MNLLVNFTRGGTGDWSGTIVSPPNEAEAQTCSTAAVRAYLITLSPHRRRLFMDNLTMVFCRQCGGRRRSLANLPSEYECNCEVKP